MKIGEIMTSAIQKSGCKTAREFSRKVGIREADFSGWRNGFTAPSANDLQIMAAGCGKTIEELFGENWHEWCSGGKIMKKRVDEAKLAYLDKTREVKAEKESLPGRISSLRQEISGIRESLSDKLLRGTSADEIETLRVRLEELEAEDVTLAHRKEELFAEVWIDRLPEIADVRADLDSALIDFGKSNLERYNGLLASVETAREAYFQAIREVFDCYRNFYQGTDKIPGLEISKVARPRTYQFEVGMADIGKNCGSEPRPTFGI